MPSFFQMPQNRGYTEFYQFQKIINIFLFLEFIPKYLLNTVQEYCFNREKDPLLSMFYDISFYDRLTTKSSFIYCTKRKDSENGLKICSVSLAVEITQIRNA